MIQVGRRLKVFQDHFPSHREELVEGCKDAGMPLSASRFRNGICEKIDVQTRTISGIKERIEDHVGRDFIDRELRHVVAHPGR